MRSSMAKEENGITRLRHTFAGTLIILSLFVSVGCRAAPQQDEGPNMVQNSGFESGGRAWSLKNVAVPDPKESHTGKYSLKYTNNNPKNYALVTQGIPVKPGQQIEFGVWLKGKNITTANLWAAKGAGIYIQGYDAQNNYVKGVFPFCRTGTFDWQQIKGIYNVPANVTRITVGLYMQKETTGTAWFDDVSVQVLTPPVFEAVLKYPNYRGTAPDTALHPWQVLLTRRMPHAGQVSLKSSIYDHNRRLLFSKTYTLDAKQPSSVLSWTPPRGLAPGQYNWHLQAGATGGTDAWQTDIPVRLAQSMPAVYIDQEGFTRINGRRFFPLGIYLGKGPKQGNWASSPDNLKQIAQAGFNTILSYYYGDRPDAAAYLKSARAQGLQVIYSLADVYDGGPGYTRLNTPAAQTAAGLVAKLKNSPNLLAWYTVDELGSGDVFSAGDRYRQMVAADPDHPVYQVNNDLTVLPLFDQTTDIIGTDPYPVSGNQFTSLAQVSDWTEKTAASSSGIKPVWEALQIFDKNYANDKLPSHPPTLDEMRNMSYQALIHGAKGLMYYAYHWLWYGRNAQHQKIFSEAGFNQRWPDVQKMIGEISQVTPFILSGHPIVLPLLSDSAVQYQAWQSDNKIMLILANPYNTEKSLSLEIPDGWRSVNSDKLKKVKVQFESQQLVLQLPPLASGVLLFTK